MIYNESNGYAEVRFPKEEYNPCGQPFDIRYSSDTVKVPLCTDAPAAPVCRKREGGCWIYCNNPEMLADDDIGQVLLENEGLSGDVVFTYEHSNHSSADIRIGYRLYNGSGRDATVTVTNVGAQWEGEWLGQKEWSDYYSLEFDLPNDYFLPEGEVNPMYIGCDFVKYAPKTYSAQTVTVPSGKYIYVIGGTTGDSYCGFGVSDTADKYLKRGKCGNGCVKFNIDGIMTGSFVCYITPDQVVPGKPQQGYITERGGRDYSAQYKGIDRTAGLIETETVYHAGDGTPDGALTVGYDYLSDPDCAAKTVPYCEYSRKTEHYAGTTLLQAINPNCGRGYIGSDMMNFGCVTEDGRYVSIDNDHADGSGHPANTGNWMVQYTDLLTFVNTGSIPRKFTVIKKGSVSGVLATIVRSTDGTPLKAYMCVHPYSFGTPDEAFPGIDRESLTEYGGRFWPVVGGVPYPETLKEKCTVYTVTVPPKSGKRIVIDSVILANSCGGLETTVETEAEA